jgi:hypothetical protein
MEATLDYFDVNINDIWPFEAAQYLNHNRTDEQIIRLKNTLEHQILISKRLQINQAQNVTIQPFVTINDYDNGTKKAYWVRHIEEIRRAKNLKERVELGYFNVLDDGVDSFFSLSQNILIGKENNQYDYWFALKLSQYKSGIKYVSDFLNYQKQKVFNSHTFAFCEFLELVILQYKDELIDEKVCHVTEKWISTLSAVNENHDSLETGGVIKSKIESKKYTGNYRTFRLKKAESNPIYLNINRNNDALNEFWNDLVQGGYIKKTTIEDLKAIFVNGSAIKKEKRIIWSKPIKTLIEFVKALIASKKIVELSGVDHWLITIDCFVLVNSKEIPLKSLYKPQNEASISKAHIESIVQNFCSKLE